MTTAIPKVSDVGRRKQCVLRPPPSHNKARREKKGSSEPNSPCGKWKEEEEELFFAGAKGNGGGEGRKMSEIVPLFFFLETEGGRGEGLLLRYAQNFFPASPLRLFPLWHGNGEPGEGNKTFD